VVTNGSGWSLTFFKINLFQHGTTSEMKYKNSSGDEIANVNFYAMRPEATRIRWSNAK